MMDIDRVSASPCVLFVILISSRASEQAIYSQIRVLEEHGVAVHQLYGPPSKIGAH